jgi:hypothetical protein
MFPLVPIYILALLRFDALATPIGLAGIVCLWLTAGPAAGRPLLPVLRSIITAA